LDSCVRHEIDGQDRWKFPPASKELTIEIALAINACVEGKLEEYTLLLSTGDLLVIDYNIRQGHKNMEGARGQDILLKVFHALSQLALGYEVGGDDQTYKDATAEEEEGKEEADNADTSTKSGSDEDANTNQNAGT
ncbi:hypothetical protein LCGC14_2468400, partial [marine sediment metagenome]